MASRTYVVNEIVGTSSQDVDDAIRNGVKRACLTVRNLDWFEVVGVGAPSRTAKSATTQVTMKVGFRLEGE